MSELKYSLKKLGVFNSHYLLRALRDIPEHGVRAGDYGGVINKKVKLSHEGSCWIGRNAMVFGNVTVSDDAYIGGNAIVRAEEGARIVVKDSARIFDEVKIQTEIMFRTEANRISTISGNAQIFGKAQLKNISEVSGNAKIFGSIHTRSWVSVTGNSEISGNVYLQDNVSVSGNSKLTDNVTVESGAIIHDSIISGSVVIARNKTIVNGEEKSAMLPAEPLISPANTDKIIAQALTQENMRQVTMGYPEEVRKRLFPGASAKTATEPVKVNESFLAFEEVMTNIASYETDIVKIIQYPVMTDRTDSYTRAMVSAVNKAKRYLDNPASDAFKDAVLNLEDAFLAAESNARKLSSTHFSEAEKKQAEKAKDLLSLAANEASSEQEKKNAFKQGFKQLEGLINVPDVAVDTFRAKIGLKEIES